MDPKLQTSFIPKKPLIASTRIDGHHSINFFFLIGLVVFIISAVAAGYVFLEKQLTQNHIKEAQKSLATTRETFDPSLIDTLTQLDNRFEAGKDLLNHHLSVSSLFQLLESITLKSVRFTSLTFTAGTDLTTLSMKGEGESFSSIALQSDVLGKIKSLKNPIISDLVLEQNGNVGFQFNAAVDPSAILYKNKQDVLAAPVDVTGSSTASTTSPQ